MDLRGEAFPIGVRPMGLFAAICATVLVFESGSATASRVEHPLHVRPASLLGPTDGRHLVAGPVGGDPVRVVDDRNGFGGGRRVPVPAGCDWWGAIGGGQLAFDCHHEGPDGASSRPVLYDLAAGRYHLPAHDERLGGQATANGEWYEALEVGRRLVGIHADGVHVYSTDYFDWVVGDWIPTTGMPTPLRSSEFLSLDTPTGRQTVCEPVRFPSDAQLRRANSTHAVWRRGEIITVQGCGSHHRQVLTRHVWGEPILTGRYAAWTTRHAARVMMFKSGRLLTWRFPSCHAIACGFPPEISGTNRHFFINYRTNFVVDLAAE
jgi:hypothetical protein